MRRVHRHAIFFVSQSKRDMTKRPAERSCVVQSTNQRQCGEKNEYYEFHQHIISIIYQHYFLIVIFHEKEKRVK